MSRTTNSMFHIKLLCLSAMAASAAGAIVVPAASAAPHWVINGTALGSGSSESVLGLLSGGSVRLISKIGTLPIEIVCTSSVATGTITGPNKGEASSGIAFTGCSVPKPSGCTVKEPITTVPLTSELLSNETVGLDTVSAKSGTELTTITITGTACSIESKTPVSGNEQCELELNTQAETGPCLFSDSSGKGLLKLGSNEATILAHVLTLLKGTNDGKSWGVKTP
jgi:hypothetical protein